MASDHIRASDHDRDAVVATLRDAFSEGRLSLEEFQERTTATYAARTWGDLKELTTDLPWARRLFERFIARARIRRTATP